MTLTRIRSLTLPSKLTVTDKYVKQAFGRFDMKCAKLYVDNFPYKPASLEFWKKSAAIDHKLTELLAKRPITRQQIDKICARAFKSLRTFLIEYAATIEQPKYKEAVNLETGETRLFPDE